MTAKKNKMHKNTYIKEGDLYGEENLTSYEKT